MIRLSPRIARERHDAWIAAAWTLWNAFQCPDPEVKQSYFDCLSMACLWKWLELALRDQNDRRWTIQPMEAV